MSNKCPGQDDRFIQAEAIKCPGCAYIAEIFTDEIQVKCPQCQVSIYRSKLPSCIDWCKSARECIGEEKYKQLKRDSALTVNSAESRVASVRLPFLYGKVR